MTRLLIPLNRFRVATLDELGLWLVEVEEAAVFWFVEKLRADSVDVEETAVFLVVEELRAESVGVGEVAGLCVVEGLGAETVTPLPGLLKLLGMQLDAVPQ